MALCPRERLRIISCLASARRMRATIARSETGTFLSVGCVFMWMRLCGGRDLVRMCACVNVFLCLAEIIGSPIPRPSAPGGTFHRLPIACFKRLIGIRRHQAVASAGGHPLAIPPTIPSPRPNDLILTLEKSTLAHFKNEKISSLCRSGVSDRHLC